MKAAQIVKDEGIGFPILLGNVEKIKNLIKIHNLELEDCPIIDPRNEDETGREYGKILYEKRKRKGMTMYDAAKAMRDRNYYGAAMLELGLGDVLISGLTKEYAQTVGPALRLTGLRIGAKKVAGMYIINTKRGQFFFADTTVNVNPSAEELVDIVGLTAETVEFFGKEPKIAMLSYSNFGSSEGEEPEKMMRATALAKQRFPNLKIDGEIQANIALNLELLKENYPFSVLAESGANTFIFPNLSAGNIAYKLLQEMGGADVIGPILMGLNKPVHILQLGSSVREIVNMVVIGVVDAQMREQQTQHC
jgi:malate dehydrogenase (oxaloacetate-decarboxylating)(NADP+)